MYETTTTIKATLEQIEAVSRWYGWKDEGLAIDFAKSFLEEKIKEIISVPSKEAIDQQLRQVREKHLDELDKGLSQIISVEIKEAV